MTENNMVIPHGDELHNNVPGEIAAISEKTDPVEEDILLIEDSEDSNNKKKVLLKNVTQDSVGGGGFASDIWRSDTGSQVPGPANTRFRWNQVTQNTSTEIYVNDQSRNGIDVSALLALLVPGDHLRIQRADNATQFQEWRITSSTDNTTFFTFVVTLVSDGGGNIANNKDSVLTFILAGNLPDHASTHLPSGSDPLATGTPSDVGSVNAEGSGNAFARQDHVHNHANQAGGSLHADVIAGGADGFMTGSDKTKLNDIEFLAEVNNISDPDASILTGGGNADALHTHSEPSEVRQAFHPADPATNDGNYRVRAVPTNGSFNFNFHVPLDFASLVSAEMVFLSTATFTDENIDLSSEYGAVGEAKDNHAETDVAFTASGVADQKNSYSVASVLASLAAGDSGGIEISHQSIGTTLDYLGIVIRYNT